MMQFKQLSQLTWITTTHCPAFRTNKSTQTSSETVHYTLCCTSSETDAIEWESLTYYNSLIHPSNTVVKLVSDTVQHWSKTTTMRHPARKRSSIWYSGLTNPDLKTNNAEMTPDLRRWWWEHSGLCIHGVEIERMNHFIPTFWLTSPGPETSPIRQERPLRDSYFLRKLKQALSTPTDKFQATTEDPSDLECLARQPYTLRSD